MSKLNFNSNLFKNASNTMQIIKQLPHKKRLKHLKELHSKLQGTPIICADTYGKIDDFLQYKIKFLRLSNPKVFLNEEKSDEIVQDTLKDLEENFDYKLVQDKLAQIIESSYDKKIENVQLLLKDKEPKVKDEEDQRNEEIINKYEKQIRENKDHNVSKKDVKEKKANPINKSGLYKFVDGELIESLSEPRFQTEHTNWDAGNADPEDLNKHKEMLDRQYFAGPMWENRKLPMKAEDDYVNLLADYEDLEGETNPNEITAEQIKNEGFIDDETVKEGEWKQVKR